MYLYCDIRMKDYNLYVYFSILKTGKAKHFLIFFFFLRLKYVKRYHCKSKTKCLLSTKVSFNFFTVINQSLFECLNTFLPKLQRMLGFTWFFLSYYFWISTKRLRIKTK